MSIRTHSHLSIRCKYFISFYYARTVKIIDRINGLYCWLFLLHCVNFNFTHILLNRFFAVLIECREKRALNLIDTKCSCTILFAICVCVYFNDHKMTHILYYSHIRFWLWSFYAAATRQTTRHHLALPVFRSSFSRSLFGFCLWFCFSLICRIQLIVLCRVCAHTHMHENGMNCKPHFRYFQFCFFLRFASFLSRYRIIVSRLYSEHACSHKCNFYWIQCSYYNFNDIILFSCPCNFQSHRIRLSVDRGNGHQLISIAASTLPTT